jgi:hypothetical protein
VTDATVNDNGLAGVRAIKQTPGSGARSSRVELVGNAAGAT